MTLPAKAEDDLLRRIADCLEQHLPAFGFDPYRYPSGENKSVSLLGGSLLLSGADGVSWRLTLTCVTPPAPLLAMDGKPGCPVTVWDGPFSTRCSLGATVGKCAYHGTFARPT